MTSGEEIEEIEQVGPMLSRVGVKITFFQALGQWLISIKTALVFVQPGRYLLPRTTTYEPHSRIPTGLSPWASVVHVVLDKARDQQALATARPTWSCFDGV